MVNKNLKTLRYYFLSGAVEGLLSLIILFIIPADPKNVWVLGFSKLRLVIAASLLVITVGFGLLASTFEKKEKHLQFANRLAEIAGNHPVFGPVMLLACGLVTLGPYLIVTYPALTTLQGIQIRIFPIMFYALTRLVQTIIVWMILARQAVPKSIISDGEQTLIQIDPRKVAAILAGIAGLLILTSVTLDVIEALIGSQQFWGYRVKFDLDQEANVPTYFSSLILLISASLLAMIGTVKTQTKAAFAPHWKGLALLFFLMSVDETAVLHERLIHIFQDWFKPTGFFYYGWVIAAIPLVIIVAATYLRFFFHLSPKFKWGISLAAFLFLSGGLGMEMLSAWFAVTYGENNSADNMLITLEESLELFAVIIFIYTFLVYIEENLKELRLKVVSSDKLFYKSEL
jgi:hypothetical protein